MPSITKLIVYEALDFVLALHTADYVNARMNWHRQAAYGCIQPARLRILVRTENNDLKERDL